MVIDNLVCEERIYSDKAKSHHHPYCQMILPVYGKLLIEAGNDKLSIDENHLFLMPPGYNHTYFANDVNKSIVIDIPGSVSRLILERNRDALIYKNIDERWQSIKYLLQEEMKTCNVRGMHDLIKYALNNLFDGASPKSIQYIHDHIDKKISIKDLADIEKYNPSYYIAWFQQKWVLLRTNIYNTYG